MTQKQKSTWQKVRKLFNDLHLWMGIASGLILFVVCLSGTIYTFNTEVQEFMEPEKFTVQLDAGVEPMTAEAIMAKVAAETGGKVSAITIPADPNRTYTVNVKMDKGGEGKGPGGEGKGSGKGSGEKGDEGKKGPEGAADKGGPVGGPGGKGGGGGRDRGTNYLVNPYTAEVIGTTDSPTSEFFMTMFRLHRWLLLDTEVGRPIVGWATVIFTLIVLSGLVIWFPQKVKNWRQGLKIKWSGNWKRVNHDLHNSLGFYSSFLLLVMSLTGLTWSFEWYKEGFFKVLGVTPQKDRKEEPLFSKVSTDLTQATTLTIADYLKSADAALPYKGDYRISFSTDSAATVSISKNKVGFFAPAASDKVQLDQYSGQVLKAEIFADKPFNEKITSSIKPLHVGNVYGTFSKILYFLACLVATSLPVTGTIIWINKLRKKSKKGAIPVARKSAAV
ncbi:PepSY-associated TM helix domain-containing protein [Pontibacter ramchanderi]|uniref:Putative iron-regulated membrane protein n=1 Tax=Pontibacter ramchanderi TaxID=1179743 RepID=A0A2N3UCL6_9BACT|nr:PepSY-associated TM helix domain-containing protein [Pontibacter ramchanderi]PKV67129.1 putative iron-regulated membrane protein [Pontibacter ramchanderi]